MDNRIKNFIFESLLRQAIIENHQRELASLPSEAELAKLYAFSDSHHARMKALFIRERRREFRLSFIQYAKKAVACVAVIATVLFGLLMLNPQVRAAVSEVFAEWYEKFTKFGFSDSAPEANTSEWRPEYLPNGFSEDMVDKLGNMTAVLYLDEEGHEIRFSYNPKHGGFSISSDNENRVITPTLINGLEGYKIQGIADGFENGVIWVANGYVFDLWSFVYLDELIKVAESVVQAE